MVRINKWLIFASVLSVALVLACSSAEEDTPVPATVAPAATVPSAATVAPAAAPTGVTPQATAITTTQKQLPPTQVPTGAIERGGVITLGTFEPPMVDVQQGSPLMELEILSDVHRGLLQVDYRDRRTIVEDIATSWETNNAGDVYTFKIRQGIKDSDGQPFGVDDVIYNFNRVKTRPNDIGFPRLACLQDAVDNVERIDGETVKVNLSSPLASFIPCVSSPWFLIEPKRILEVIDAPGEKRDLTPEELAGVGPFKVKGWTRGSVFEVEQNENYWEYPERPYLDGFQTFFFTDASAQLAALRTGRIMMSTDTNALNPTLVIEAAESTGDKAKIVDVGYMGLNGVIFNLQTPPFDDLNIRNAVNLAIDRKVHAELKVDGWARAPGIYETSWDWIIPEEEYLTWPGLRSFESGRLEEDLAEGQRLMQSMGFGPSNMLKTDINCGANSQDCQYLVSALKDIYIDLSIRTIDNAATYSTLYKGDFHLWTNFTSLGYEDPDNFNSVLYLPGAGRNVGKWENQEWLDLFNLEKVERDLVRRGGMLRQMAEIWWEDMPQAPIYTPIVKQFVDTRIQGYNPPLFNQANYRHDFMWLEK